MIKEFPANVFLVRVFCDKCGCQIENYKNATSVVDLFFCNGEPPKPKYEYTCKNCGNVQVEETTPTFIVKGAVPNNILEKENAE